MLCYRNLKKERWGEEQRRSGDERRRETLGCSSDWELRKSTPDYTDKSDVEANASSLNHHREKKRVLNGKRRSRSSVFIVFLSIFVYKIFWWILQLSQWGITRCLQFIALPLRVSMLQLIWPCQKSRHNCDKIMYVRVCVVCVYIKK